VELLWVLCLVYLVSGFYGHFDIVNLPKNVYPSTTLPLDLSMIDFSLIVVGALVIVVLSAYYPAKKASEVDILTVLRNE